MCCPRILAEIIRAYCYREILFKALHFKYEGKLCFSPNDTIGIVKLRLEAITSVSTALLRLVANGKPLPDDALVSSLSKDAVVYILLPPGYETI